MCTAAYTTFTASIALAKADTPDIYTHKRQRLASQHAHARQNCLPPQQPAKTRICQTSREHSPAATTALGKTACAERLRRKSPDREPSRPASKDKKQDEALRWPRGAPTHTGSQRQRPMRSKCLFMQPLCAHHMAPNLGLSHLPVLHRACSVFAGQTSTALTT